MSDTSREPMVWKTESIRRFLPHREGDAPSVERHLGNAIWPLTTATHATRSEDSSATSATPPSESGSSMRLPQDEPPSTSTKSEKTCCPTHWWKPSHSPLCETTFPSRRTMEVYP